MANHWHYKLFGEEFGPVPEESLRDLLEQGSLAEDDEVRTEGGAWMPVLRALNGSSTASNAATATAVLNAPPKHADDAEEWYCQVLGQELGPISFNDLLHFAEIGEISGEDQIRFGTTGKWRRVGSMGRLVAVLPYQAAPSPTRSKPKIAAAVEKIAAKKPASTVALTDTVPISLPTAVSNVAYGPAASELGWFAWIRGVEYGPSSLLQLQQWVTTGQLASTDFVKYGHTGVWCPPATVAQILAQHALPTPHRHATPAAAIPTVNPPVAKSAAPVAAPPPAKPSPPAVAPKAEVPAPAAKVDPPKPSVASVPVSQPETPPAPRPTTSSSYGSSTSTWQPSASKPAPRPIARSRSSSRGGSSIDLSFLGPLMEPKNLGIGGGVIAAGLLVYAMLFMSGGYGPEKAYFKELHGLYVEFQKVREKKGSAAEVEAIAAKHAKISPPMIAALEKRAGAERPATQNLLFVAKYRIKQMLESGVATRSAAEIECEKNLYDASKMLGLTMDPPKPVEKAAPKGPVNPNMDKGT